MSDALPGMIRRAGRLLALVGVVLPLLFIGGLKFTLFEAEALKPMITGTPWMAWMYPAFGYSGGSRVLGVVEISTALLLIASPRSHRAGIVGGAVAVLIFASTISLMLVLPIWESQLGGFPALSTVGQFLLKDVALLAISLVVLSDSWERRRAMAAKSRREEASK
jgi:reactive chlorine resistance protein C